MLRRDTFASEKDNFIMICNIVYWLPIIIHASGPQTLRTS